MSINNEPPEIDVILAFYERHMADVKPAPCGTAVLSPDYRGEIHTLGIEKLQGRYDELEARYFDACDERDRGAVVIGWMAALVFVLGAAVVAMAYARWF